MTGDEFVAIWQVSTSDRLPALLLARSVLNGADEATTPAAALEELCEEQGLKVAGDVAWRLNAGWLTARCWVLRLPGREVQPVPWDRLEEWMEDLLP